jgi:type II secretory pathway pseudopilin PulG
LVVILIIALLIGILLPTVSKAREQATKNQCLSRVRQRAIGSLARAADYERDREQRTSSGCTLPSANR